MLLPRKNKVVVLYLEIALHPVHTVYKKMYNTTKRRDILTKLPFLKKR
jgi:hypothetical protein